MKIDLTTPERAAGFLLRLTIYAEDDIVALLVRDYDMSAEDARALVSRLSATES